MPAQDLPVLAKIPVPPGFAFQATLSFLAPRAPHGLEQAGESRYSRLLESEGRTAWLDVTHDEARRLLVVQRPLELAGLDQLILGRVQAVFDVAGNAAAAIAHLGRAPFARQTLRGVMDLRLPGCWDPFELAVRAILGQQVSVAAASTLMNRLIARFGEPSKDGTARLFPRASVLADADLTGIGLTRARAATIRGLAQWASAGGSFREPSTDLERIVTELQRLPGIGPWTAHYIALRAYRHPDAFPVSDLGLRRAAGGGKGPLPMHELARRSERWKPWRAYAAVALWQSACRIR